MLPPAELYAKAILKRGAADADDQTLVTGARAVHLPSTPSARSAHPHTT